MCLLRFIRIRLCAIVLIIGAGTVVQAFSANISGTLKDQKDAVLAGGTVVIRNLESSLSLSTTTDREGNYKFENLPQGRYQITASFEGFEPTVRNDVQVGGDQPQTLDFVLAIALHETVVVITAPAMMRPLVVETDTRPPRQPIPANDGADYLKSIPGFSSIRKGGTYGDPTFRGMAGSRLNILLDGQQILGGCGGRMDPPTAYVFPDVYRRITVLKGPQTVLYGPNSSAGTVLFERERERVERAGILLDSSATLGSYGRHDEMFDAKAAIPNGYVQGIVTRSHSDDYRDGNGNAVHSFYTRWSANAEMGWTPAPDTFLAFSASKSDAEAAYADRTMDGVKFARENLSARFDRRHISSLVDRIEAQLYYNYIDHVMDNYSLRTPATSFSANNPDRRTTGGRAAVTLLFGSRTTLVLGLDSQRNVHKMRNAMGAASADLARIAFLSALRMEDMRFNQAGLFAEGTRALTPRQRLIAGFRTDWHRAEDSRMCVNATMCPGNSPLKNNTMGTADHRNLKSGFGRYELDFGTGRTLYAGIGHAERPPDYWERLKQDPVTLKSVFLSTRSEKNTQLDVGMIWRSASWSGSVSGFYGKIRDYILMRWNPAPVLTRNVDAATMGGEADVSYNLPLNIKADAAFSYVRSSNDTDHKPLAQQPPLESRIGLTYDNHKYSYGMLARLVGRQDRVDIGSGNIVANGMDIGRTAGFAVFSINGGYRLKRALLVTGGVDNLLDKAYTEHLSKSGAMVPGFVLMSRINEPGRTFWIKANFRLE
jgi:iron complex outermembrane recepter protein